MKRGRIAVAVAAVALLAFGAARVFWPAPPVEPITAIDLHGVTLRLRTPYLRPGSEGEKAHDRVTLAAFFPDFSPAGSDADIGAKTDLAARFAKTVTIDIAPADDDVAPDLRVSKLYLRFLDDKDLPAAGGLTVRAFKDDSPFAGDTLFYTPPEGAEFAARCPNGKPDAVTPSTCASAFRVDGLDIGVRFPAPLIGEWSAIKSGALGLVAAARR